MIDTTDLDARLIIHRVRIERANRAGWMTFTQTDLGGDGRQRRGFLTRVRPVIAQCAHLGTIARVTVGIRLGSVRSALGLNRTPL